jgi:hypothetical protein
LASALLIFDPWQPILFTSTPRRRHGERSGAVLYMLRFGECFNAKEAVHSFLEKSRREESLNGSQK